MKDLYWNVIEQMEAIDYCTECEPHRVSLTQTDKLHPIYDQNEHEWREAPRTKSIQHWDQVEMFDTFALRGQDESF